MYYNFVNHESETKERIHQWVRGKVDYDQEKKKQPYTFHGDTSFFSSLLPDTSQLKLPVVASFLNNVLDPDTRADLENVGVLNWCRSVFKLFAVNVPRDGSCLLHSAFVSIWGVTDSNTTLRELLLLTISNDYNKHFKSRWQCQRTRDLPSIVDHSPEILEKEWEDVIRSVSDLSKDSVSSAAVPHRFLESIHVFALANILRRPIIVLADPSARSPHGSELQENHMSGIYLPLEWNSSDCCKTPIILGYSQNHFCPLICESVSGKKAKKGHKVYPLVSQDLEPFKVRFLTNQEENQGWELLQAYLNVQEIEVEARDRTKVTVLCAELDFKSLSSDLNTFQEYLQLCEKTYNEAFGGGVTEVSRKESQKQKFMTTNKAAEVDETAGNPYHSIQLMSQTEVVHAVRSPAGKTSHKKSGVRTNTEMAQQGRGETSRGRGNNKTKCSTPDCNKRADPNENNLCDDCIKKLSVLEAGAELVSVEEGSAHFYQLRREQSTGPGNEVQNSEKGNFAMGNEQYTSPSDLEMIPTAPPLSYLGPPSINQLSSMMDERCHNCRQYRCSTRTHPLCHECFEVEQKTKRENDLQNIMPTAPGDSVSFVLVEGNEGKSHGLTEGMKGLSVSQGVAGPHDMPSYKNITGQLENESKNRGTNSADEKVRNDTGAASTSRFQQPTSTGLANGSATAPVTSFRNDGRSNETGAQAFAETDIKTPSDIEVSEEPAVEVKCPGPRCPNFISPSERLCKRCIDILLRYGPQESEGTRNHVEASSRSNLGGREIELQREKERQFSGAEVRPPPPEVSTYSSIQGRPHVTGKPCITPDCPNFGDPSMAGKCTPCFLTTPAAPERAFTAPLITRQGGMRPVSPKQARSERIPNTSVTYPSTRYVPSQSFSAAGGPPMSSYYPSDFQHRENIPSQPISMVSDVDEFSSFAPSSSVFRPVPTSSGMSIHNFGSMMVTSKTSWSTGAEEGQGSGVTATKPLSGVTATKPLSGVTATKPRSGVTATKPQVSEADKEFQRTHENLEETFKRMSKKCKMDLCQNYGNQRKKGYCNSCYEVYRRQFEAMQVAQYGEDVPDNIVYDSTMSI